MGLHQPGERIVGLSGLYGELTRPDPVVTAPAPGTWMVTLLDEQRRRRYSRGPDGDLWAVGTVFKWMPYPSDIRTHDHLPRPADGDRYLVLYGGGPDIYDHDDVNDKTSTLVTEMPGDVIDIVLVHRAKHKPLRLWSVRAAAGISSPTTARGEQMPFPAAARHTQLPWATPRRTT